VVERIRTMGDHTNERVLRIGSLCDDAEHNAWTGGGPWQVESRLHSCLDVQLDEDQS